MVSQMLGMFFENIVQQKRQSLLLPCLLPVVWSFMNAKYDSPFADVPPDHVIKFFIDMTLQEKSTPENNIHNKIAISFLQYIQNYYTERKEMCRVLAKELITLQLNLVGSEQLKSEMLELADQLATVSNPPAAAPPTQYLLHFVKFALNLLNFLCRLSWNHAWYAT